MNKKATHSTLYVKAKFELWPCFWNGKTHISWRRTHTYIFLQRITNCSFFSHAGMIMSLKRLIRQWKCTQVHSTIFSGYSIFNRTRLMCLGFNSHLHSAGANWNLFSMTWSIFGQKILLIQLNLLKFPEYFHNIDFVCCSVVLRRVNNSTVFLWNYHNKVG